MTPGAPGAAQGARADGGGVVVTGAARGIGAAVARRFAEDGYAVIGVDLDGDQLHKVMAELPGGEAVTGDVTDEKVMAEACELGAARGLRAFVANAGVARPGRSADFPMQAWDQLLAVHLTAAFTGARAACQRMPDGGAIVMISSVNGHLGFARADEALRRAARDRRRGALPLLAAVELHHRGDPARRRRLADQRPARCGGLTPARTGENC